VSPIPEEEAVELVEDDAAAAAGEESEAGEAELPEYATLEFSAQAWWKVMEQCGVDTDARHSLFLLAQLGEAGEFEANQIIHQMVQKDFAQSMDRPSAWLHSCAFRARKALTDGTGKGGRPAWK